MATLPDGPSEERHAKEGVKPISVAIAMPARSGEMSAVLKR